MGSGAEAVGETVGALNATGEKNRRREGAALPAVFGRGFRRHMPKTVKSIAVLDRTKEPGALGEPLYLDVVAALRQAGKRRLMRTPNRSR